MARTYSTREVAQMWNLSESTVKRWADSGDLDCSRTPGGHRRFRLQDVHKFQVERGFEATGLIDSEPWEDPQIEVSVNKKDFDEVRTEMLSLAVRNQRSQACELLKRLFLRGVPLTDLYDQILLPLGDSVSAREDLSRAQSHLIRNNLEEAMSYLFPEIPRRRQNGRMALCATPGNSGRLPLNAVARILELEGWECLNLGQRVAFEEIAEMVQTEPVNLVCLVGEMTKDENPAQAGLPLLRDTVDDYRIPLVFFRAAGAGPQMLGDNHCFARLDSLRQFVQSQIF